MCDKCDEIDRKIAHYKQLATRIDDKQTLAGIDKLIEQMTTEKTTFGCDRTSKK